MFSKGKYMISHVESKMWHKLIYGTQIDSLTENRLVVAKGNGKRIGWTWSLGLVDANY